MTDLFGQVETVAQASGDVYADYAQQKRWSIKERLNGERDTLGLYLTAIPLMNMTRN